MHYDEDEEARRARIERMRIEEARAWEVADRHRHVPEKRALVVHDDVEPPRVEDLPVEDALALLTKDGYRDTFDVVMRTSPRLGPRRIVIFLPAQHAHYVAIKPFAEVIPFPRKQ